MKKVSVKIPGTIANLVCGYDILGMAVNDPYDEMEVSLTNEPGIRISHIDEYGLPEEPNQNVAGVSLLALQRAYGKQIGFDVIINKRIKPGSGLGSSAASAAGAVVAANHLLNNFFSKAELVQFAMCGEELASGVKHADNIAPCIYGGVTLIRSLTPLDIIALPAPKLFASIVHPQITIKTSEARKILPAEVPLKDAVKQWGNIAGLVAGLFKQDNVLISRSLTDYLIEPVRSKLIPGFDEIKSRSINIGSLGGGISGSGPSIFMLSEQKNTALEIEAMMNEVYVKIGIDFKTYVSTINDHGISLIDANETIQL